jgi:diguanylate cyclase (GGDEF)-like protein
MTLPRTNHEGIQTLIALARGLSNVESLHHLREALVGPLAELLPMNDLHVKSCVQGHWETIVGPHDPNAREDDYVWRPLVAGRAWLGHLGVRKPVPGTPTDPLVDGAAELLAIGIQHLLATEALKQHSARDSLTGCVNHGHGVQVLASEMSRAARSRLPLSIMMMDIDGFKDINDSHGHLTGDAVLASVGSTLVRLLRQSDIRCRYGGDEFLIILPDTKLPAAIEVAETLRRAIQGVEVTSPRGVVTVTPSIGVAARAQGELDITSFIDRADVALYEAKQNGRNCVQAYSRREEEPQAAGHESGPRPAGPRRGRIRHMIPARRAAASSKFEVGSEN